MQYKFFEKNSPRNISEFLVLAIPRIDKYIIDESANLKLKSDAEIYFWEVRPLKLKNQKVNTMIGLKEKLLALQQDQTIMPVEDLITNISQILNSHKVSLEFLVRKTNQEATIPRFSSGESEKIIEGLLNDLRAFERKDTPVNYPEDEQFIL